MQVHFLLGGAIENAGARDGGAIENAGARVGGASAIAGAPRVGGGAARVLAGASAATLNIAETVNHVCFQLLNLLRTSERTRCDAVRPPILVSGAHAALEFSTDVRRGSDRRNSWSCLHPWLARSPLCPVCKAGVSKDNIIPVFANGADSHPARAAASASPDEPDSSSSSSPPPPQSSAPPRPQARRPAPSGVPRGAFPGMGGHGAAFGGGFGLLGGLFPGVVLFHQQFQWDGGAVTPAEHRQMQQSRFAFAVGLVVLLVLMYF